MLPIHSELVKPEYRRMGKVIDRAMTIDCFFYLSIAVVGWLSELEATETIVLERKELPGKGVDYAILVAVLLNIVAVIITFPLCFFPFR